MQENDWVAERPEFKKVCAGKSDDFEKSELLFAVKAVKSLKSNAICITRGRKLLGMGAGLPSRVDAARLALEKAGAESEGAILSSDAFFPFPDSIEIAAEAGISAVIQPGSLACFFHSD